MRFIQIRGIALVGKVIITAFPNSCLPQLKSGIVEMSQKLGRFPPFGTSEKGNVERTTFKCGKCAWRIDLENLVGTNLRQ